MREIRFRGRNKHTGLWHFGSLLNPTQGYHFPQIWDWHIDAPYPVLEETVGQLTGLFDKDGNEIYEGDIVFLNRTFRHHPDGDLQDNFLTVQIEFSNGAFWFRGGGYTDCNWHHYPEKDRLVIGNIYENPELLNND